MGRNGDIFLHGITPRSGINFVIEIIKCHPHVSPSLRRIWEFPHLEYCNYLKDYNRKIAHFPKVLDVGETDLLPYFGEALLNCLAAGIPSGQRLILKSPTVKNLKSFFSFFPESYLLILVRDGRDFACSAMKTTFAAAPSFRISRPLTIRYAFRHPLRTLARRWVEASKEIVDFIDWIKGTQWEKRSLVIHYEDMVNPSKEKITALLEFLELDPNLYNWKCLSQIKVRGSSFHSSDETQLQWDYVDVPRDKFRPIGRWENWSQKEHQIFLSEAEESLRYWGYIK